MAWPPALPSGGRSNETPQRDQHPADHNLTAAALDTIVNYVDGFLTSVTVDSVVQGSRPVGHTVGRADVVRVGALAVLNVAVAITQDAPEGGIVQMNLAGHPPPIVVTEGGSLRFLEAGVSHQIGRCLLSWNQMQFWLHGGLDVMGLGDRPRLSNGDQLNAQIVYVTNPVLATTLEE
jgi:hypothetical protein